MCVIRHHQGEGGLQNENGMFRISNNYFALKEVGLQSRDFNNVV